jgi:hypothetical protein
MLLRNPTMSCVDPTECFAGLQKFQFLDTKGKSVHTCSQHQSGQFKCQQPIRRRNFKGASRQASEAPPRGTQTLTNDLGQLAKSWHYKQTAPAFISKAVATMLDQMLPGSGNQGRLWSKQREALKISDTEDCSRHKYCKEERQPWTGPSEALLFPEQIT